MTPRARAVLFALPLVIALLLLGVGLPRPPPYRSLPIPVGSFDLSNSGRYDLGLQYADFNSTGPRYRVVSRADYWDQFVATVNASGSYRVRGTWTASAPTMVVLSWNALWTADSVLGFANYGCAGFPGQFCAFAMVVTNTSGTVDVTLSSQNWLCTNPPDIYGPCVDLGYGIQGYSVTDAGPLDLGPGAAVISVIFVSFAPDTVTVLAPFFVTPA